METHLQSGIAIGNSPYLGSILAPQLRLRGIAIVVVPSLSEFEETQANFSIIDATQVTKKTSSDLQKLQAQLFRQHTSIALTIDRNYQQKLDLLDLGFSHCFELPVPTSVIIKTIEIQAKKAPQMHDTSISYTSGEQFTYLHAPHDKLFLVNKNKTVTITAIEKRLLEYLSQRQGFASIGELSYIGWKHFGIKPNTVTVTIKKLRLKLQTVGIPKTIRNLYGYGYSLTKPLI
ncbi:MAG: helix-turn-helix domain-containing protein [Candidatus Dojkabacteria bacterium]|nr:MAG: helix-turn-helix domain-containing protein [Candidatus Dojkabacteria bacterium]